MLRRGHGIHRKKIWLDQNIGPCSLSFSQNFWRKCCEESHFICFCFAKISDQHDLNLTIMEYLLSRAQEIKCGAKDQTWSFLLYYLSNTKSFSYIKWDMLKKIIDLMKSETPKSTRKLHFLNYDAGHSLWSESSGFELLIEGYSSSTWTATSLTNEIYC